GIFAGDFRRSYVKNLLCISPTRNEFRRCISSARVYLSTYQQAKYDISKSKPNRLEAVFPRTVVPIYFCSLYVSCSRLQYADETSRNSAADRTVDALQSS